jgi:low temperature requirement protein LtrA
MIAAFSAPWTRRMTGRDPEQPHRASTPLELLFDLCFVAAISQAAAQLAHGIEEDHVVPALLGFLLVFFAIWWAWMNFTWFASAYDTDDVPYRLLTLVQMAGVLVLAAGVPAALDHYDFTVATIGYAIMRVPGVLQWLRAAREDPGRRATCLRYAVGIAVVQVLWIARLALPHPWDIVGFVVLVVAELAVPIVAELRGEPTTWHPEHIAERYGLFTLIVLGECVLGTTVAFQSALGHGFSADLVLLAVGGLLLIFGLWWTYFLGGDDVGLTSLRSALTWGYGHYLVFGSVAALGAGLEVAVQTSEHAAEIPEAVAGLAVAVPVAVFLVVISQLRRLTWPAGVLNHGFVAATAVLVLVCGALAGVIGLGPAVLAMGVVLGALLAAYFAVSHRRAVRADG